MHRLGLVAVLAAAIVALLTGAAGGTGSTVAAPACTTPSAGDHELTVDAGSGPRPVRVHVPQGAGGALPLVLGLGGAGQTGADFAQATSYSRLADRERFLVAYPTATGTSPFWNVSGQQAGKPDDVAFLAAVLDEVEAFACVDRKRVYATGVSNGGGMTALLGCALADRLAAIAPVAGGYGSLPPCRPSRPLAVLEVHGGSDDVVPYAGKGASHLGSVGAFLEMWRRIDGCGWRTTQVRPTPNYVDEETWTGCAAGADVVHDLIEHERHSWPAWARSLPSRTVYSTTWRTWAFFRGHARPPAGSRAPATTTGGPAAP